MLRLAHGDLGTSFVMQQPVLDVLHSQLWPTMQLALSADVLALVLAMLVATVTAGGESKWNAGVASLIELTSRRRPCSGSACCY